MKFIDLSNLIFEYVQNYDRQNDFQRASEQIQEKIIIIL